jgi:hypothetical protein
MVARGSVPVQLRGDSTLPLSRLKQEAKRGGVAAWREA